MLHRQGHRGEAVVDGETQAFGTESPVVRKLVGDLRREPIGEQHSYRAVRLSGQRLLRARLRADRTWLEPGTDQPHSAPVQAGRQGEKQKRREKRSSQLGAPFWLSSPPGECYENLNALSP